MTESRFKHKRLTWPGCVYVGDPSVWMSPGRGTLRTTAASLPTQAAEATALAE